MNILKDKNMNQKMLDVLAEICENALNDERNKEYL